MQGLLALAFVLLHLAAIKLWPAHAMVAPYVFLIAMPLVGATAIPPAMPV